MLRFVAFLRAVNVGGRTVAMTAARDVFTDLGLEDVSSFANTGNLLFSATGSTTELEQRIRPALEAHFGFELTTFVRTAAQVRTLTDENPFGALADGHTHFALFTATRLSAREKRAVEGLSGEFDTIVVGARDVHWLMRGKSIETKLGPRKWLDALPNTATTARNMNLLRRLARKL